MQTPSIGRIVHYYMEDGSIAPAIVTDVQRNASEITVDLFVMASQPRVFSTQEVLQGDKPGEWNWPPFVPPVNKPDPKPIPTKFDLALILNKHVDATPLDVHRAIEEIMDLFEDFLK